MEALRVVTPLTTQGAPLQKHRRADTWAIMNRKTLQIKNETFHGSNSFPSLGRQDGPAGDYPYYTPSKAKCQELVDLLFEFCGNGRLRRRRRRDVVQWAGREEPWCAETKTIPDVLCDASGTDFMQENRL